MSVVAEIKKIIKAAGNKERAKSSQWFFKTGKGQYGEGDMFWGITVPIQRKIAKGYYRRFTLDEILELLHSPYHEERFIALEMLVMQFEKADPKFQKRIATFYIHNAKLVNNWDLVDTSAPYIVGPWILSISKAEATKLLLTLAKSKNVWERRIAIVSNHYPIARGHFEWTVLLCEQLLQDKHDLIHKACGWMLREVGKKDASVLKSFLDKHAGIMPRTMLRYSIEKLSPKQRAYYLSAKDRMV